MLFRIAVVFSLYSIFFCNAFAQKRICHFHFFGKHCIDSTTNCKLRDSLKILYGKNKDIPKKYELEILIALSHYPELTQTEIEFKETAIPTTLNARPTVNSLLFKSKGKRKYVVRINNSPKEGIITINEVPFNARIGIFAHEFSHFIDFQNRSFGGVMKRLWAYTSKKRKAKYEREIDSMTVARGLKWQMYDWSYYAIFQSDASEEYKLFKKDTYLKPKEILEQGEIE